AEVVARARPGPAARGRPLRRLRADRVPAPADVPGLRLAGALRRAAAARGHRVDADARPRLPARPLDGDGGRRAGRRRPLLRPGRPVRERRDRDARAARSAAPAQRRRRGAVLLEDRARGGLLMPIAGEVAIVGWATTEFGVHHERGYLDLLAEAAFGAV